MGFLTRELEAGPILNEDYKHSFIVKSVTCEFEFPMEMPYPSERFGNKEAYNLLESKIKSAMNSYSKLDKIVLDASTRRRPNLTQENILEEIHSFKPRIIYVYTSNAPLRAFVTSANMFTTLYEELLRNPIMDITLLPSDLMVATFGVYSLVMSLISISVKMPFALVKYDTEQNAGSAAEGNPTPVGH